MVQRYINFIGICQHADSTVATVSNEVSFDLLVSELEPVTNWFVLGLHLGVAVDELHAINGEHLNIEYSRIKMLDAFTRNAATDKSWSEVVHALIAMGEIQVAKSVSTINS